MPENREIGQVQPIQPSREVTNPPLGKERQVGGSKKRKKGKNSTPGIQTITTSEAPASAYDRIGKKIEPRKPSTIDRKV